MKLRTLERFHERGFDGLVDQSTRPQNSPGRTTGEIAVEIIRLRQAHPTWGPKKIRATTAPPFAAGRSLAGLTKLSAWWISLGIDVVRSRPGCPQDNGAHERMHADISIELQTQSAQSIRAQQRACDDWRVEFNHIRPHEALGLETPADVYRSSPRPLMRARIGGFPDETEIVKLGPYKFWLDGRHHVLKPFCEAEPWRRGSRGPRGRAGCPTFWSGVTT